MARKNSSGEQKTSLTMAQKVSIRKAGTDLQRISIRDGMRKVDIPVTGAKVLKSDDKGTVMHVYLPAQDVFLQSTIEGYQPINDVEAHGLLKQAMKDSRGGGAKRASSAPELPEELAKQIEQFMQANKVKIVTSPDGKPRAVKTREKRK